jgi:hypothetical protein
MSNNNGIDWLLVPMEVSALVVGSQANKHFWSDLAPDYSKIWNDLVLVGPDLVTLFPQGGSNAPPGAGIHLHWFLPEAFGHGVENEQGIDYPHIPNRWLVRRVRYAPDTCDIKDVAGWVVESDFLHETDNEAGEDGTVSMPYLARPMLFDSVGRVTPLQSWTENNRVYRFTLTALGSGSPDFAAYYPACKSVLGFHDPDPGAKGDWQVSYLVTGWCSDPEQDLLHGVTADNWQAKLEELQWSSSSTGLPRRVLCHGAVSRMPWNSSSVHISPVPTGKATVCVGNTSAEALATLLARKMQTDGSDASLLEPLLAAFQYDMLGSGQHLGDVQAELHRHRFVSLPGGDRYTIDAKRRPVEAGAAAAPDAAEQPSFVQHLPADIESALYELNVKAREAARLQRELGSLRQALFTTWCRWAKQYTGDNMEPTALNPDLNRSRAAVAAGAGAAQAAQAAHQTAREKLEATLTARLPDMELACSTEPPFYRATDPAVLIAGKGLAPSGVSDEYIRAEYLPCRRATEIVTGFSADIHSTGKRIEVSAQELFPLENLSSSPSLGAGPSPDLLDALLRELLVLDPVDPQQRPPAPPLADRFTQLLEEKSSITFNRADLQNEAVELLASSAVATDRLRLTSARTGVTPTRPDAVALFRWTANPWRPLLLMWEVKWHPDPGQDGEGDLPQAWKPWSLDERGNEFKLPNPVSTVAPKSVTYKSYAMLAPHAEWVLRRRLEALRGEKNYDVSEMISNIDSLEVLSQSLGGFHDALRQLRHGLQLPPINPAYVLADSPPQNPKWDEVADPIYRGDPPDPQHMHAPDLSDPSKNFLPIRAGQIEISRLWLVDSFGQTCKLIDNNNGEYELLSSFGLPGPSQVVISPRLIPLPPRYVQPARLDFRWLSAGEDQPGGRPLCGWIFPNHMDKSLMICDATGKLWGAVQQSIRVTLAGGTGGTQGQGSKAFFWVPVPGTEATPSDIPDPRLRSFVRYLVALDADADTNFLKTIEAAQNDAGTAPEHDPRLSILIGKPLALARASLRIELMGLPVRRVPPATSASPAGAPESDPTRGFTRIRFPVRLGAPAGHAGGLVGYFVDGEDGVFCPRHGLPGGVHELSLEAERAVELTLLLDPVAPVHARCGLLPRTSLHLPQAVVAGLSSIRDVFFQNAPLVGPPGGPRVPRPSDDYGQWSWAARPRVTHWQEYAEINDPGDRAAFGQDPPELQEGWLKLVMNPVSIAAFWVKEGSVKVAAGSRVTLGWMVEGAETLTLSVKDADQPLASWSQRPGSRLPEEYRLPVSESVRLILTATDRQGNHSVKSLQIDVTQGGASD